jgi:hypothetical protein
MMRLQTGQGMAGLLSGFVTARDRADEFREAGWSERHRPALSR